MGIGLDGLDPSYALTSTISAVFQKKLPEHEVSSLLEQLQTQGVVIVCGTKVPYEPTAKSV